MTAPFTVVTTDGRTITLCPTCLDTACGCPGGEGE